MLHRTVFVSLIVLVLMKLVVMDPMEITFNISVLKNQRSCDHNRAEIERNKYTVLEGEELKLTINSGAFINVLSCADYSNIKHSLLSNPDNGMRNVTKFKVLKSMGVKWQCKILSNMDTPGIQPVIIYKGHKYAVVYCYMQIHVRQTTAPQTILVNNMVVSPVRNDLSVKDVDLTAVYEYADGDMVNVTCTSLQKGPLPQLTISSSSLTNDLLSEVFNSANLSSDVGVGFRAKLHSGHSNASMICNYQEPNKKDYTTVMVKFVMKTTFDNIVSLRINGMILRPQLKNRRDYKIQYEYISNQQLAVQCDVKRDDMKLVFIDEELKTLNGYDAVKESWSSFLPSNTNVQLKCAANSIYGDTKETVEINFDQADILNDQCALYMDLPSNGTVIELYESNRRKVIYYEFEDGEKLTLTCNSFCTTGPVIYLQFKDSDERNSSSISQTLQLTREQDNTVKACYIKEQSEPPTDDDKVLREISVIFREKSLTTTTAPTTEVPTVASVSTPAAPVELTRDPFILDSWILVAVGSVTCIVIICVSTVICKLRKRNHAQGGPYDRNYVNLQTQSEASIPPYPTQWESQYAVPADQRADNATYSVPYKPEAALYSTPIPKSERKNNKIEPTYAILNVQNSKGHRNTFKDLGDPNYAEVVSPKSQRSKTDNNPYAYVTNERTYANTDNEPEPMYCEPNAEPKGQNSQYANVFNNTRYANSSGQEYVEPSYSESYKRNK